MSVARRRIGSIDEAAPYIPRQVVDALQAREYRYDDGSLLARVQAMRDAMPLYDALGYPQHVRSLAEFSALPLLRSSDLAAASASALVPRDESLVDALAARRLVECASSSRTTRSFVSSQDGKLLPAGQAEVMRVPTTWLSHRALLTSPVCSGGACETKSGTAFTILPPTSDVFAETEGYFRGVHRAMSAIARPFVLIANPIVLAQVVRRSRQLGLELPRELVVLSTYQRLPAATARLLSTYFGHWPYEQYGASELAGCYVSNTCIHRKAHVWTQQAHVEVVDDAGRAVADGALGNVVVTNVGSHGTQLLRYMVGDLGRLTRGDCDCGLNATAHLAIEGRRADAVRIDGEWLTEGRVDDAMSDVAGVAFHQVTRVAEGEYRVTVVPEDGATVSHDAVMSALGPLLRCTPAVVTKSAIAVSAGQKYPGLRNWTPSC